MKFSAFEAHWIRQKSTMRGDAPALIQVCVRARVLNSFTPAALTAADSTPHLAPLQGTSVQPSSRSAGGKSCCSFISAVLVG